MNGAERELQTPVTTQERQHVIMILVHLSHQPLMESDSWGSRGGVLCVDNKAGAQPWNVLPSTAGEGHGQCAKIPGA